MPEEITAAPEAEETAVVPVEGTAEAPTAEAADLTPDKSTEDWRASLSGISLELANRATSKKDFNKIISDYQRMASLPRVPPKDGATPEQIAAYRKAVGAPEDGKYEFAQAEGVEPSEADLQVQSKVAEVLGKYNAPAAMAGELQSVVAEVAQAIEAEQERVAVQARENVTASLRREWGRDFDGNVELAARAAKTFGGDDFMKFVAETMVGGAKLGDHPAFVKTFGQIGRRMGEGEFIGAVNPQEHASLQQQLSKAVADMHVAIAKRDSAEVARLKAVREELTERMAGREPIVGREGRQA